MNKILLDVGPSGPRSLSRIQDFLRCARLFAFKHKGGIVGAPSPPLVKGALVHVGMAHFCARLQAISRGEDLERYYDPLAAMGVVAQKNAALWGATAQTYLDICQNVVDTLFQQLRLDEYDILFVEQAFEFQFGPFTYTQKPDAVVRERATGRIKQLDWKCLPKSAVLETLGGRQTVGDLLVAPPSRVLAWTRGKGLAWRAATKPVAAGRQDVYTIKTQCGLALRAGARHPVLTPRGWVAADHLRPGDRVAAAIGWDRPDAAISDAALYVITAMLCDGGMTHARVYTKNCGHRRGLFLAALRGLGYKAAPRTTTARRALLRRGVHYYRALPRRQKHAYAIQLSLRPDSPLSKLFAEFSVAQVGAKLKAFPPVFDRLSQRQARVVLGALLLGDGYVGSSRSSNGRTIARVSYSTVSPVLAEGVKRLFTQCGYASTVVACNRRYKGRPYRWYQVTVGGESRRLLLRALVAGVIPAAPLRAKARRLLTSQVGLKLKFGGDHFGLEPGCYWTKVTSTLVMGHEECFDISVPGPKTFVADGLITHNSSSSGDSSARRYATDVKMLALQDWGARLWGESYGGVLVGIIGLRDSKLTMQGLEPAPALVAQVSDLVIRTEKQIRALEAEGLPWNLWPPTAHEQVCWTSYGECEWREPCKWGAVAQAPLVQIARSANFTFGGAT